MRLALGQAQLAYDQGEVPVGAALVLNEQVIATGYNRPITQHDPTSHAEIVALRSAGNFLKNYRLLDTTLYVTLEPCIMCIGAIAHARVKRLVYGASDSRVGAIETILQSGQLKNLNHSISYKRGVLERECSNILKSFFKDRR